jgi:hypothetical protein
MERPVRVIMAMLRDAWIKRGGRNLHRSCAGSRIGRRTAMPRPVSTIASIEERLDLADGDVHGI